jgi:hypothetical protein
MELDDISELCVSIDCRDILFPLCFIRKETLKFLVVDSTREDGTEGLVVIPKSNVLSVSVVYEQDLDALFMEDKKDEMFG